MSQLGNKKLRMLPMNQYPRETPGDPIRFYRYPVIGSLYRRRVELCLTQLRGGGRILEIGFGSGVTFLNLHREYEEIHGLDLTVDTMAVSATFLRHNIRPQLRNGDVLALPYPDDYFDCVLLISILEHLKPESLDTAFQEITRVLRRDGQAVYGVPVERPFMTMMFRLLGYNIREHHFSSEDQVAEAAARHLKETGASVLTLPLVGKIYRVGNFVKA